VATRFPSLDLRRSLAESTMPLTKLLSTSSPSVFERAVKQSITDAFEWFNALDMPAAPLLAAARLPAPDNAHATPPGAGPGGHPGTHPLDHPLDEFYMESFSMEARARGHPLPGVDPSGTTHPRGSDAAANGHAHAHQEANGLRGSAGLVEAAGAKEQGADPIPHPHGLFSGAHVIWRATEALDFVSKNPLPRLQEHMPMQGFRLDERRPSDGRDDMPSIDPIEEYSKGQRARRSSMIVD